MKCAANFYCKYDKIPILHKKPTCSCFLVDSGGISGISPVLLPIIVKSGPSLRGPCKLLFTASPFKNRSSEEMTISSFK